MALNLTACSNSDVANGITAPNTSDGVASGTTCPNASDGVATIADALDGILTEPADEGAEELSPVITEKTLVLARDGSSEYTIIIPKDATDSNVKAANELQSYVKRMSGVTLPIKSDSEKKGSFEISVGYTNRTDEGKSNKDKLGEEGYAIYTVGKSLFVSGSGVRGALYGVYGLLEDYFGCRFYSADVELVPQRDILGVDPIELDEQIPAFEYREIDFVSSRKNDFQVKLRANGTYSPGGSANGGKVTYSGGFVHTLGNFVPLGTYFTTHPEYFALNEDGTRQTGWDHQLCLSNPDVLRIVKDKVRSILANEPNAKIISISQNDGGDRPPCLCEKCKAVYEEEGSYSGSIIRFVNAVAEEFKDDYPNLKFDTLSYRYSRKVCKTKPADNVIVRLCTIECCFSHPLGTCDDVYALVGSKNSIAKDIAEWANVTDNIYVWDYATNFKEAVTYFPNLNVLRANARFFADHNVIGVYEEANYFSETCDFPELRSYVMSKLLWDPYMSEEEYQGHINDFLKGYYGKGWRNIRKYINLAQERVADYHFGIYERFTKTVFAPTRSAKKNTELLSKLTLDMVKDYQNTDWESFFLNYEPVEENDVTAKGRILFEAAISMASEAEAERIRKAMLQIDFLYAYAIYEMYGEKGLTYSIGSLLSDFFQSNEEAIEFNETDKNSLLSTVSNYVIQKYSLVYEEYSKDLHKRAVSASITKIREGNALITDGNIDHTKTPYLWK